MAFFDVGSLAAGLAKELPWDDDLKRQQLAIQKQQVEAQKRQAEQQRRDALMKNLGATFGKNKVHPSLQGSYDKDVSDNIKDYIFEVTNSPTGQVTYETEMKLVNAHKSQSAYENASKTAYDLEKGNPKTLTGDGLFLKDQLQKGVDQKEILKRNKENIAKSPMVGHFDEASPYGGGKYNYSNPNPKPSPLWSQPWNNVEKESMKNGVKSIQRSLTVPETRSAAIAVGGGAHLGRSSGEDITEAELADERVFQDNLWKYKNELSANVGKYIDKLLTTPNGGTAGLDTYDSDLVADSYIFDLQQANPTATPSQIKQMVLDRILENNGGVRNPQFDEDARDMFAKPMLQRIMYQGSAKPKSMVIRERPKGKGLTINVGGNQIPEAKAADYYTSLANTIDDSEALSMAAKATTAEEFMSTFSSLTGFKGNYNKKGIYPAISLPSSPELIKNYKGFEAATDELNFEDKGGGIGGLRKFGSNFGDIGKKLPAKLPLVFKGEEIRYYNDQVGYISWDDMNKMVADGTITSAEPVLVTKFVVDAPKNQNDLSNANSVNGKEVFMATKMNSTDLHGYDAFRGNTSASQKTTYKTETFKTTTPKTTTPTGKKKMTRAAWKALPLSQRPPLSTIELTD